MDAVEEVMESGGSCLCVCVSPPKKSHLLLLLLKCSATCLRLTFGSCFPPWWFARRQQRCGDHEGILADTDVLVGGVRLFQEESGIPWST